MPKSGLARYLVNILLGFSGHQPWLRPLFLGKYVNQSPRSGLAWPISSSPVVASQGAVRTVVLAAEDTHQQYSGGGWVSSSRIPSRPLPRKSSWAPFPASSWAPGLGLTAEGYGGGGIWSSVFLPGSVDLHCLPRKGKTGLRMSPIVSPSYGRLVPRRMCTSL